MSSQTRVGVVGARGRMGRIVADIFRQSGDEVVESDIDFGPAPAELAAICQVVVLAAPIPALEGILAELGPRTRPDGVTLDIASVKEGPVSAMLAHCQGEVIGGHPLFGPGVASPRGQVFFVCPARGTRWRDWLTARLELAGCRVVETTARDHDLLMAKVQALRHMLVCAFGLGLAELGFRPETELALAGQWFPALWDMLERQSSQPAGLFADLAVHNPHVPGAALALGRAASAVTAAYAAGDRSAIAALMDRAARVLERPSRQEP